MKVNSHHRKWHMLTQEEQQEIHLTHFISKIKKALKFQHVSILTNSVTLQESNDLLKTQLLQKQLLL